MSVMINVIYDIGAFPCRLDLLFIVLWTIRIRVFLENYSLLRFERIVHRMGRDGLRLLSTY